MNIRLAIKLNERLNENAEAYEELISQYSKEEIIRMAHDIVSISLAYKLMTTFDFEDYQAEFLLKLENPLEVIADEYVAENLPTADNHDIFALFMHGLATDAENLQVYPLISDVDYEGHDEDFEDDKCDCILCELIERQEFNKSAIGLIKEIISIMEDV